jgi:hypothetical protein
MSELICNSYDTYKKCICSNNFEDFKKVFNDIFKNYQFPEGIEEEYRKFFLNNPTNEELCYFIGKIMARTASYHGRLDFLKFLREQKIEFDRECYSWAIYNDQVECFKFIHETGVEVELLNGVSRFSPTESILKKCISMKARKCYEYMVDSGIERNASSSYFHAVDKNDIEFVKFIYECEMNKSQTKQIEDTERKIEDIKQTEEKEDKKVPS